jgi:hypothetical protein
MIGASHSVVRDRFTIRAASVWFAAYAALAVAMTYPLALHTGTRVPHDLGDPLLSTVILWWNAHHVPLTAEWWNGSFFFPGTGTIAFSDHRLGLSLIASPLQWAGLGPLAAYNITLLATFPLCALAAHWAAFRLTGRHDASVLAGLAYGFNPYRFAHIEHLELLAAFGMPVALGALHGYLRDRNLKWAVLLAVALFVQALASSYYFLFFLVLLALWMIWFLRPRDYRIAVTIALSVALAIVAMAPIAFGYMAIHTRYGLSRGLGDIVTLSADVTSFVTASPLSALWGWTSSLNGPERQLFPGATIVVVVAIATLRWLVSRRNEVSSNRTAWLLFAVGTAFTAVAAAAWRYGPAQIGPLSIGVPFKPLSLAFYGYVGALLASSPVRRTYRHRSSLAFFVLATMALLVFSLGPKPAFLHQQFLYEPPYSWLMRLSVFRDSVRVPARFGMPAILTLSVAGALAFARLVVPARPVVAFLVAAGIVADAGIARLPLLDPPASWPSMVSTTNATSFVELPLGETLHDAAAMYRTTMTSLPTANGMSGYYPQHYEALRLALDERDETALDALATRGPLIVVVELRWPYASERLSWLRGNPRAHELASTSEHVWFLVDSGSPRPRPRCDVRTLPIAAMRDFWGPLTDRSVIDGDQNTVWVSGESQHKGDGLTLDLGGAQPVCSLKISVGKYPGLFPRSLTVASSADGLSWQTSFSGKMGGDAVLAALENPRNSIFELPLPRTPARFVRVQLDSDAPHVVWIVADVAVTALPRD